MKDWAEKLVDDICELDNQCYNLMPLTIVIRTDLDDDGNRFFDATVYTGHNENEGEHLADVIGASQLPELFDELVKEL